VPASIASSRSRRSRTSWRERASTCCARARRSIRRAPSADHADGRRPGLGFGSEPVTLKGRDRRHPCWTQDRTRTEPSKGGLQARDSVRRTTRTWTVSAMTDECLASSGAAKAALTRTVTGAILAPHETQRLVVNGKTGRCSSSRTGKSIYVPIDPGGEMVTPLACFQQMVETTLSRPAACRPRGRQGRTDPARADLISHVPFNLIPV